MLRITQNRNASSAKSYYAQGLESYYSDAQEHPGLWGGLGAERLELVGLVEPEKFRRLCDNLDPATGASLTPRTKANRRVGYDFNFHAPKSVSLLHALTGDARIVEAFRASVADTLKALEAEAQVRIRRKGQDASRVSGSLCWAEFIHFTARPVEGVPDPHLHSHNFVFNASFDPVEKRWKAVDIADIKRDASFHEAVFHARFAKRLADLGFSIERNAKGWELAGFERETLKKFSRRTELIEELAREKGVTDPESKGALGAETRQRKQNQQTRDELRAVWDARLTDAERWSVAQLASGESPSKGSEVSAGAAMDHALADSFERHSVTSERRLMAAALRYGVGSVSPEQIQAEVGREGIITRLFEGQRLSTTLPVLREEQKMVAWARNGRGACRRLAPGRATADDRLTLEQRAAVRHVWDSFDRVVMIRGAAGVGKTTLMGEVVTGIEASGTRVFAFAPSAEASRGVLRADGFENADTVASLLLDEKRQEQIWGQILWIDEAGTLGVRQMGKLFALAERCDCRVILTGDIRQNGPVERGDALRILETQAGVHAAEVLDIRRQQGAYKEAVTALSRGDIAEGYDRLDALGFVRELVGPERHRQLASDYLEAVQARKSALVVAPTHREGLAVTTEIRQSLRDHERLGAEERPFARLVSLSLTEALRRDPAQYEPGYVCQLTQNLRGFRRGERLTVLGRELGGSVQVRREDGSMTPLPLAHADRFEVYRPSEIALAEGDMIRITKNGTTQDKKHRLDNGALHPIQGFTASGDLQLGNGWVVAKDFAHLDHGYCTTAYASQGKTVDRVFIALGSESFPAISRESFYVAASRARERCSVYTDDSQALRARIQESGVRMSAGEMTAERPKAKPSRAEQMKAFALNVVRLATLAEAYASQALDHVRGRQFPRGHDPDRLAAHVR